MDALLALPLVITAVVVIAALGPSNVTVTICIGFIFAPLIARTVRTAVIQERELDYVTAARLRNENGLYIMISELLPNVLVAGAGGVHRAARVRGVHGGHAVVSGLRHPAADA